MVKPPTSVRSIRLADATWDALTFAAERRGTSVNALVAKGVEMALAPAVRTARTETTASVPLIVPVRRVASDEPLRMPRAPIGSRLDKKLGKTKR